MTQLMKSLSLISLMALAAPTFAQSTDGAAAPAEGEEAAPDPLALSMGEVAVGSIYVDEAFKDWELRCVKSPEGQTDPCQLYQLLKDPNGNPVAEINVFPIGGEGQPAAGATVVTPLETLLTESLGLSVDGSPVVKYPFSWCSQIGCFSRIGFTAEDVNRFRRGVNANLVIVPVVAPDQKINLRVSLSGFTAGFNAVSERAAQAAAAQ